MQPLIYFLIILDLWSLFTLLNIHVALNALHVQLEVATQMET